MLLRRAALLASALLPLAACADRGRAPARDPGGVERAGRYGGTAVVAVASDVGSLNPLTAGDNLTREVLQFQLFLPLLRRDSAYRVQPLLAERWDTVRVGRDSLDLTFHLRRDVRWHDGAPTDARDVLFSFRRMLDPRTGFVDGSLLRGYSPAAVLVDGHTIRFRLRPFPGFLEVWSQVGPAPRHLLENVPPGGLARAPFSTTRPVGNGPYRWAGRAPGRGWTLEANPDFPAALGGRPYLDRIVYRVIPEPGTAFTELATGGVDLVRPLAVEQAARVRPGSGMRVEGYALPEWMFVGWNTRREPFRDERVRRALSMAVDGDAILRGVARGQGTPGRSIVAPQHWSFDAADPGARLPHDPAAARRLLDAAGWRDRDGGGVRTDARGRPLRFDLLCTTGALPFCDAAQAVQAQLAAVGVRAEVKQEELATLLRDLYQPGPPDSGRGFDAVVFDWVEGFAQDDHARLHSAALSSPAAITGYSSPRLDSLLDAVDRVLDHDAARPLWRALQHETVRAAPFTVLYYPRRLVGVGPRLQGVRTDARGMLVSSARWWIAPAARR